MKKIISLIVILVGIAGVTIQCGQSKNESSAKESDTLVSSVKTADELNTITGNAGEKLLVLDFYADWCGPCRMLAPTFHALAKDYPNQASFYKVNVDKSQELARQFGVNGIPYVVFIRDKAAIYAITGLNPREKYESVINSCNASVPFEGCRDSLKNM